MARWGWAEAPGGGAGGRAGGEGVPESGVAAAAGRGARREPLCASGVTAVAVGREVSLEDAIVARSGERLWRKARLPCFFARTCRCRMQHQPHIVKPMLRRDSIPRPMYPTPPPLAFLITSRAPPRSQHTLTGVFSMASPSAAGGVVVPCSPSASCWLDVPNAAAAARCAATDKADAALVAAPPTRGCPEAAAGLCECAPPVGGVPAREPFAQLPLRAARAGADGPAGREANAGAVGADCREPETPRADTAPSVEAGAVAAGPLLLSEGHSLAPSDAGTLGGGAGADPCVTVGAPDTLVAARAEAPAGPTSRRPAVPSGGTAGAGRAVP